MLHGVCVVGIMGYLLVGGLILLFMYHHLCLYCISYDPCDMYPYIFFLFFPSFMFCIPIFWYTLPLVLLFLNCVYSNHNWMKTFGGCMHMYFIICSYMCILKYVYSI